MLRKIAAVALVGLGLFAGATFARAEDYPSRPIRLIVPFPPGGSTDITGRIAAEFLSRRLGQNVVVENRPGAGTAIGHDLVAKSKPDGYTLVWGTSDGLSILPAVRQSVPYRVPEDFTFIGTAAKSSGQLVAVPTKLPFHSMAELIAFGKANPGKLRYSTSGVGGGGHLTTVLIAKTAGIEMVHVAYSGNANAVNAAIGGFVDVVVSGASLVKPYTDAGSLRVLAVADKDHHPQYPDVPTLDEVGIPNVYVGAYVGLLGPAGLPDPIEARLQKEMAEMFKDPKIAERFVAIGFEPSYLGGNDFRDFMTKDLARWKDVARGANIVLPD